MKRKALALLVAVILAAHWSESAVAQFFPGGFSPFPGGTNPLLYTLTSTRIDTVTKIIPDDKVDVVEAVTLWGEEIRIRFEKGTPREDSFSTTARDLSDLQQWSISSAMLVSRSSSKSSASGQGLCACQAETR